MAVREGASEEERTRSREAAALAAVRRASRARPPQSAQRSKRQRESSLRSTRLESLRARLVEALPRRRGRSETFRGPDPGADAVERNAPGAVNREGPRAQQQCHQRHVLERHHRVGILPIKISRKSMSGELASFVNK